MCLFIAFDIRLYEVTSIECYVGHSTHLFNHDTAYT